MAMKRFKEIKVCTGEYKNNDGEQKKSYAKVGTLFQDDESGNFSIKLDTLPFPRIGNNGELGCWLSVFDPYDENKQQAQPSSNQQFGQAPPVQPMPQQQPVYQAPNVQAQPVAPIQPLTPPVQQPVVAPQQLFNADGSPFIAEDDIPY